MKKLFLASEACEVLDKLIKILPKPPEEMTLAFIPTAADPYKNKDWLEKDRKKLVEKGFKVIDVDLKGKTKEKLMQELENADIIFVAGGNTFYLLGKARESGFDELVRYLVSIGIIYVGSSAGTVLAGPNIEPIKVIDDPEKAPNLKSFEGLNLVNFVILPHLNQDKYKEKYEKTLEEYKEKFKIITITDSQAVLVENGWIEIV